MFLLSTAICESIDGLKTYHSEGSILYKLILSSIIATLNVNIKDRT